MVKFSGKGLYGQAIRVDNFKVVNELKDSGEWIRVRWPQSVKRQRRVTTKGSVDDATRRQSKLDHGQDRPQFQECLGLADLHPGPDQPTVPAPQTRKNEAKKPLKRGRRALCATLSPVTPPRPSQFSLNYLEWCKKVSNFVLIIRLSYIVDYKF